MNETSHAPPPTPPPIQEPIKELGKVCPTGKNQIPNTLGTLRTPQK